MTEVTGVHFHTYKYLLNAGLTNSFYVGSNNVHKTNNNIRLLSIDERLGLLKAEVNMALDCKDKEWFKKASKEYNETVAYH